MKHMKVQCFLCDQIEELSQNTITGKRIRNHPLTTYLCQRCYEHIAAKTIERKETGLLKEPVFYKEKNDW